MSRPVLVWLVAFGFVVAGCGGTDRPEESPDALASPTANETSAPTPKRPGGVLNLASRDDIAHLDVHQELSPALVTWGPGIAYSRLLRFSSGPNVALPSLAVECELCDDWEMVDDTTFEFHLRENVRWQNLPPVNGRVLTADDVVFSYGRQGQAGWPNAPLLRNVAMVEAPESHVVRVSLGASDADFMAYLADGHSKIVAREAVEVRGDLREGPTVGSGPWIFTGTQPGDIHTFERNPEYFETGVPSMDGLNVHVITAGETRAAAFRTGALDVEQMTPREWRDFQQGRPEAPFVAVREAATGVEVAINTSAPPFGSLSARRAVLSAMDPWAAVDDLWLGHAFVKQGTPVPHADWLLFDSELRAYFGDLRRAQELLQESGARLPVPVTIKVGDFGDTYLAHAEKLAEELRPVGFEPILEVVDKRRFGEEVWKGGDYQMFLGTAAPIGTPNGYLLSVLHSDGQWNTTGYRDAELDRLIDAQAGEYDPALRKALVREIQMRSMDGAHRFMPAAAVSVWTWWPRVKDFYPNTAGFEYFHWAKVRLGE